MEIVKITDGDYEKFEKLVLKKEALDKECFFLEKRHTALFGNLINLSFKAKITSIGLKKKIAMCQIRLNRGEKIDMRRINGQVKKEMASYYDELDDMICRYDKSRSSAGRVSDKDMAKIKKLYREIVKLLHPDISPLTGTIPELSDYFQRAAIAYKCNSLKELEETYVCIKATLAKNGISKMRVSIPDVLSRIREIEGEIAKITSTNPYLYKRLLDDESAMTAKTERLQAEIAQYGAYVKTLEAELRKMSAASKRPAKSEGSPSGENGKREKDGKDSGGI